MEQKISVYQVILTYILTLTTHFYWTIYDYKTLAHDFVVSITYYRAEMTAALIIGKIIWKNQMWWNVCISTSKNESGNFYGGTAASAFLCLS